MIEFTKPSLPPISEYVKYLRKIWRNRRLTNSGNFHDSLERKLENFLGVRNLALTANGTLALQLLFRAMDLRGEVITTPFTFAATANALVWEGIKPIFADINPETFNIEPDLVEKKINRKTSAILAVHVFGSPCYPRELERLARKHNIKLIFDAAHAFGVKHEGRSVLSYGDASVLSFHATKAFNTIEGGAVVTKSSKVKRKVALLRNFGIDYSRSNVVLPGINAKLNEFQAAMGLVSLKYFRSEMKDRRKRYEYYKKKLSLFEGVKFQKIENVEGYNYAYMPVLFGGKRRRDRIHRALARQKIVAKKYFHPLVPDFLYFKKKTKLPVAAEIADSILCLPLHPSLSFKDINRIVGIIEKNL